MLFSIIVYTVLSYTASIGTVNISSDAGFVVLFLSKV